MLRVLTEGCSCSSYLSALVKLGEVFDFHPVMSTVEVALLHCLSAVASELQLFGHVRWHRARISDVDPDRQHSE